MKLNTSSYFDENIKYTAFKKSSCKCLCMVKKYPYYRQYGGGAMAGQPTGKKRMYFIMSLTLTEPIFNNFQENGASGETLNLKN